MASGPLAPPGPPARTRSLSTARPGAVLTAAAAVPLGAAVLYASGWLAWGPRLALGIAVVVLGNALRKTVGTVTGARIGASVARAVGVAFMAGGLLIAIGAVLTGLGLERSPAGGTGDAEVSLDGVLLLVGVPAAALLLAALAGLVVRTPSTVRSAQGAATAFSIVTAWGVLILAQQTAVAMTDSAAAPALDGPAAVGGVALLVLLLFGSVLLAATTARRPSRSATAGAIIGTVGVALWAATLSVATAANPEAVRDDQGAATVLRPLDLLLGFGDPGRLLHDAEPGWPVLFGVVGLVLLGAAAWLESRRPLPASTPVAAIAPDDD